MCKIFLFSFDLSLPAYLLLPISVLFGFIMNQMLRTWNKFYHDLLKEIKDNPEKYPKKWKSLFFYNEIVPLIYREDKNGEKNDIELLRYTRKNYWLLAYVFYNVIFFLAFSEFWWVIGSGIFSACNDIREFYFLIIDIFTQSLLGLIIFPEKTPEGSKYDVKFIEDIFISNTRPIIGLVTLFTLNATYFNRIALKPFQENGNGSLFERFIFVFAMIVIGRIDRKKRRDLENIKKTILTNYKDNKTDKNKVDKFILLSVKLNKFRRWAYGFLIIGFLWALSSFIVKRRFMYRDYDNSRNITIYFNSKKLDSLSQILLIKNLNETDTINIVKFDANFDHYIDSILKMNNSIYNFGAFKKYNL